MNILLAIKASQIHVAVRSPLMDLQRGDHQDRHEFEQKARAWEQPFIAASNLVKFHHETNEPVYETRVYNNTGTPMALAFASRFDDWEPLDRGDPITLLSDLAGDEQLAARQRRITDRKKAMNMREGKEWQCSGIGDIFDGVANPFL